MKYSIVALSGFAAMVMAEEPTFLNSNYIITEGEPFTLEFSGCDSGCTINLQTGPKTDTEDVETLTTSASGGSFTVTLDDVPSGTYNFYIKDNESGEFNYSPQFQYEGTGEAPSSSSAEETTAQSTSAEETSTATETVETTITSAEETTLTTVTSTSAEETSTEASTTAEEEEEATTTEADLSETTAPDGGAGALGSPMGLVMGAAAAAMFVF